jgi:MoaA/NifB/PqqE/SkfB family radical SAM enzyme
MRSVTIYTTSSCNLRCKHCGVGSDQYKPRTQQTTDELKQIIKNLANGGTKWITILGGEATIYRNDLGQRIRTFGRLKKLKAGCLL